MSVKLLLAGKGRPHFNGELLELIDVISQSTAVFLLLVRKKRTQRILFYSSSHDIDGVSLQLTLTDNFLVVVASAGCFKDKLLLTRIDLLPFDDKKIRRSSKLIHGSQIDCIFLNTKKNHCYYIRDILFTSQYTIIFRWLIFLLNRCRREQTRIVWEIGWNVSSPSTLRLG